MTLYLSTHEPDARESKLPQWAQFIIEGLRQDVKDLKDDQVAHQQIIVELQGAKETGVGGIFAAKVCDPDRAVGNDHLVWMIEGPPRISSRSPSQPLPCISLIILRSR